MPGMKMDFKCQCGFKARSVTVGATLEGHYLVGMCLECHRLFSSWRKCNNETVPICYKCGNPSMPITAPGAWSPAALQKKFPDLEPWNVDGRSSNDDEDDDLIEDEVEQSPGIRILCPLCKQYSVEFEEVLLWD